VRETCKNSANPLKDQTWKSWALKKEKGAIQRHIQYIQQNNRRKFPKYLERNDNSGTRSLQDTKKIDQNRNSPGHLIKTTSKK
jgi:hypothetical protein